MTVDVWHDTISRALKMLVVPGADFMPQKGPNVASVPPDSTDDAGQHSAAERASSTALKAALDRMEELRRQAEKIGAEVSAERQGAAKRFREAKAAIDAAFEAVKAKQHTLTEEDVAYLRQTVTDQLSAVQAELDNLHATAKGAAQKTAELTDLYDDVGKGEDNSDPSLLPDGPGHPPSEPPPSPLASPAGAIQGMSPGMPGLPMPAFPSLGGSPGGMPGLSDPLSALTGLSQQGDDSFGLKDEGSTVGDTTAGKEVGLNGGETTDAKMVTDEDGGADDKAAQTTPAANDGAPAGPPPPTTEVQLPDGQTVEARTAQSAEAVRGVLGGASVSEAYGQAEITLPPPGTPVTEPLPPTQLKAGDLGVWKDHMVMALGGGKVLVSGQVQPLDSVSSGPDFLGWIDPTASDEAAVV